LKKKQKEKKKKKKKPKNLAILDRRNDYE